MEELKAILQSHSNRYPLMEPVDAVKLIYQNEFGAGHMVRDREACLEYLRREYAGVVRDPQCPLYEDIGNGIVRVQLAALAPEQLDALGRAFLRCAQSHRGTMEGFLKKLALLQAMTEAGCFAFSPGQLAQYLEAYERAGFPAVSHSGAYREAYHPAYRIIQGRLE